MRADRVQFVWTGTGTGPASGAASPGGYQALPGALEGQRRGYTIRHADDATPQAESGYGLISGGALVRSDADVTYPQGTSRVSFVSGSKLVTIEPLIPRAAIVTAQPDADLTITRDMGEAHYWAATTATRTVTIDPPLGDDDRLMLDNRGAEALTLAGSASGTVSSATGAWLRPGGTLWVIAATTQTTAPVTTPPPAVVSHTVGTPYAVTAADMLRGTDLVLSGSGAEVEFTDTYSIGQTVVWNYRDGEEIHIGVPLAIGVNGDVEGGYSLTLPARFAALVRVTGVDSLGIIVHDLSSTGSALSYVNSGYAALTYVEDTL